MSGTGGAMEPERIVREVKRLYFETTPETLDADYARALELSARVPNDAGEHPRLDRYMRAFPRLREKLNGTGENGAREEPEG